MLKQQLLKYCELKGIWVPKNASVKALEKLIVRSVLDGIELKGQACFGFWQNDDPNCRLCKYENDCFESSFGMSKDKYFKEANKAIESTGQLELKFKKLPTALDVV